MITRWVSLFDTYSLNDITPNLDKSSKYQFDLKNFQIKTFFEAFDVCNPVSTVLKWFEDF